MKNLNKVIVMFMTLIAFVPASMQANGFMRVLAKPSALKTVGKIVTNPGVILAGIGAGALAHAQWHEKRACEASPCFHKQKATTSNKIAVGFLGLAGNYFLLTHLNKLGYLPKYKINIARTFRGQTTQLPFSDSQAQLTMGMLGFIAAGGFHNLLCGKSGKPVDMKTKILRAVSLEAAMASLVYACLG